MPRAAKPKPDDPAQSKRFIETAQQLQTDENPEAFDRVFERLVPTKERKEDQAVKR